MSDYLTMHKLYTLTGGQTGKPYEGAFPVSYDYKQERDNRQCYRVYRKGGTPDGVRGKVALGRVCRVQDVKGLPAHSALRNRQWYAMIARGPGQQFGKAHGRSRDYAVHMALAAVEQMPPHPDDDTLYTLREIREKTGISRETLRSWLERGWMRCTRAKSSAKSPLLTTCDAVRHAAEKSAQVCCNLDRASRNRERAARCH